MLPCRVSLPPIFRSFDPVDSALSTSIWFVEDDATTRPAGDLTGLAVEAEIVELESSGLDMMIANKRAIKEEEKEEMERDNFRGNN